MTATQGLAAMASEILKEVRAEIERTLEEAASRARKMLEDSWKLANQRYEQILLDYESRADSEAKKVVSKAEIDSKLSLLKLREELVETVFKAVKEKLKDYVKSKEYRNDFLWALLEKAVAAIPSEKVIVTLNSSDKKLATKEKLKKLSRSLGKELVLSENAGNFLGGVIVSSPDERYVINASLEVLLERVKPSLRVKVASMLFEEV